MVIPNGSKIGMSFDLGVVKDSKYGSASKLNGIIPLLLPQGEYPYPPLMAPEQKDRFEALVRQKAVELQDMWPNDLIETIEVKIRDYWKMTAFTCPSEDTSTERMAMVLLFCCIGFATDDTLDFLTGDDALSYKDVERVQTFFRELFLGKFKSADDIPKTIEALVILNYFNWKFVQMTFENIPNYMKINRAFIRDSMQIVSFSLLFQSQDQISEAQRMKLASVQSGGWATLEYFALLKNIYLSEDMRDDAAFQMLKYAYTGCSQKMNDLFGLKRDINNEQEKDGLVLYFVTKKGLTLQEAFDKVVGLLNDDLNDLRFASKTLRETYGNNQDLMEYIKITEQLVDGQFHWYSEVERYGDIGLKVVKI